MSQDLSVLMRGTQARLPTPHCNAANYIAFFWSVECFGLIYVASYLRHAEHASQQQGHRHVAFHNPNHIGRFNRPNTHPHALISTQ